MNARYLYVLHDTDLYEIAVNVLGEILFISLFSENKQTIGRPTLLDDLPLVVVDKITHAIKKDQSTTKDRECALSNTTETESGESSI